MRMTLILPLRRITPRISRLTGPMRKNARLSSKWSRTIESGTCNCSSKTSAAIEGYFCSSEIRPSPSSLSGILLVAATTRPRFASSSTTSTSAAPIRPVNSKCRTVMRSTSTFFRPLLDTSLTPTISSSRRSPPRPAPPRTRSSALARPAWRASRKHTLSHAQPQRRRVAPIAAASSWMLWRRDFSQRENLRGGGGRAGNPQDASQTTGSWSPDYRRSRPLG
mmetsp:Transcript_2174/g.7135  ORF Transcript_2174/g.7135 Transcript_2174/m.7135 type:complete len:222 (-) Transcript_2174:16-681(-)